MTFQRLEPKKGLPFIGFKADRLRTTEGSPFFMAEQKKNIIQKLYPGLFPLDKETNMSARVVLNKMSRKELVEIFMAFWNASRITERVWTYIGCLSLLLIPLIFISKTFAVLLAALIAVLPAVHSRLDPASKEIDKKAVKFFQKVSNEIAYGDTDEKDN